MKDMFYNYDHNIDRDVDPIRPIPVKPPKVLAGDKDSFVVKNAKGDEIGVRVKKGMPFTLYFYLEDYDTHRPVNTDYETIEEILKSNTILTVENGRHQEVFTLSRRTSEVFDFNLSELCIPVPMSALLQSEDEDTDEDEEPKMKECASLLTNDTYRIKLSLEFENGSYNLFSDSDGLLIVR